MGAGGWGLAGGWWLVAAGGQRVDGRVRRRADRGDSVDRSEPRACALTSSQAHQRHLTTASSNPR
ncbi:hypothetical protein [Actinosynnema pretiosum]|uniref:Uncharacterized protein n=1 Tax=Actinosynnema pretiosum TaxID=42197 RepID=A0A290ZCG5_9PSEU|nr:hypothetical protein [Actinosynnema pretiosum]ATE56695.1 hypothetical protein CNX65_28255 [Actinosynnema pretiosum]